MGAGSTLDNRPEHRVSRFIGAIAKSSRYNFIYPLGLNVILSPISPRALTDHTSPEELSMLSIVSLKLVMLSIILRRPTQENR